MPTKLESLFKKASGTRAKDLEPKPTGSQMQKVIAFVNRHGDDYCDDRFNELSGDYGPPCEGVEYFEVIESGRPAKSDEVYYVIGAFGDNNSKPLMVTLVIGCPPKDEELPTIGSSIAAVDWFKA